ncbi:MAG TPA: hypothetical protein H9860_01365 [Candidatus Gemmiger faecavium]|nr:hypothetical protein [Candidatus Gemmiger faecavium]
MKKYQIAIISLVGALSLFFLALSSIILWAIFAGIVVLLVLLWRPKPQSSAPPRSTSRPTSADFELSIPVIPAPPKPRSEPSPSHSAMPSANCSDSPEEKSEPDVVIPHKVNNAPLVYQYNNVKIENLNFDIVMNAALSANWELNARIEDGSVFIYSNDQKIGNLNPKISSMLFDWIKRNDPYKIILENVNTEKKEAVVYLAFYRSMASKMGKREYTIAKVIRYIDEDKQFAISMLEEGDEIHIEEEINENGEYTVILSSDFGEIGTFGKALVKRILEEGAAGAAVDHIDYDENDNYIPYVKVYW